MCTPAAVVLRDQCEMGGSKQKPQKNAMGKGEPEGKMASLGPQRSSGAPLGAQGGEVGVRPWERQ